MRVADLPDDAGRRALPRAARGARAWPRDAGRAGVRRRRRDAAGRGRSFAAGCAARGSCGLSLEANGGMCRGLLRTRYGSGGGGG